MPPEVQVRRVARDRIMPLRVRVLSGPEHRVSALSRDLSPTTRHWAAFIDDTVVGCASVMRLRGWALRGMAVAPELQRHGIGARLLDLICAEVAEPMWCNARLRAIPFYLSAGWVEVGPRFSMPPRGVHQRMIWSNQVTP